MQDEEKSFIQELSNSLIIYARLYNINLKNKKLVFDDFTKLQSLTELSNEIQNLINTNYFIAQSQFETDGSIVSWKVVSVINTDLLLKHQDFVPITFIPNRCVEYHNEVFVL